MAATAGSRDPPSRGRDFTNEEYADILFCYGFANGVSMHARAEYQSRFPQRRLPHESVFEGVYQRLRVTVVFERGKVIVADLVFIVQRKKKKFFVTLKLIQLPRLMLSHDDWA